MEDAAPDEAVQLYTEACTALEEDGKDQMAFDLYRDASRVYLKLEKWDITPSSSPDPATLHLTCLLKIEHMDSHSLKTSEPNME